MTFTIRTASQTICLKKTQIIKKPKAPMIPQPYGIAGTHLPHARKPNGQVQSSNTTGFFYMIKKDTITPKEHRGIQSYISHRTEKEQRKNRGIAEK